MTTQLLSAWRSRKSLWKKKKNAIRLTSLFPSTSGRALPSSQTELLHSARSAILFFFFLINLESLLPSLRKKKIKEREGKRRLREGS